MEFKQSRRPRPAPAPQRVGPTPTVSKKSRFRRLTSDKKKVTTIGISVSVVILIGLFLTLVIAYNSNSVGSERPKYQTALPQGKTIDQLGGWKRVSPPEATPVFAYADKIEDIPVTVSQQPLPGSLSANSEAQIASLAKSYNATKELDAEGTPLYVGTSAKGPQSAIMTKKGLLILIKSQKKISDEAWAAYAASLK